MNQETIIAVSSLQDTLRLITNSTPAPDNYWYTLLAVLFGGAITILGNYLLVNRQAKIEIQKIFFTKHFDVYSKITELAFKGHSVIIKDAPGENPGAYPQAYSSFETLKEWNNSLVNFIDQFRIYIDDETFGVFEKLNHKVLEDLKSIRKDNGVEIADILTQEKGRKNVNDIQTLTQVLIMSCRRYISKTYSINLPAKKI